MSSPTGLPALHNTMGALFVGVVTAMGLWGVGTLQLHVYFTTYTNDDWWLKALVVTVWSLDTAHQGMICHTLYEYLITHYGNPLMLGVIVPTLLHEVLISAIICAMVQSFLVMRIWRLSNKNIPIIVFLLVLVIAELTLSIVYYIQGLPLETYARLTKLVHISRAVNVMAVISDVAIAATLIWLLHRSRTGFKRSETMINRLILYTINTGAATSVCALLSLITISALPNTFVYILFYVNMSRLYTNTLFATLNARKSIRGGHPDDTENNSTHAMNRVRPRGVGTTGLNGTKVPVSHSLAIKVDTEMMSDDGLHHPRKRTGSDSDVSGTFFDNKPSKGGNAV